MLEIILVFAVYAVLQKLVDFPIIRKIRKTKTAEEAIIQRKRLKMLRATFFVIFLIGYVLLGFVINFDRWETEPLLMIRKCFVWFFLMTLYLCLWRKYDEFMGNISIFGKNDYLNKYNRFALFLRGFGDDNYSKKKKIDKSNRFSSFSEYWFMYILQKRIHACAIGMTKESDSPYGAQRIYVNDESWKEDVSDLMKKAEKIYVLVNDRPSCIWEIEQTKTTQNKTVYIVDDFEKYNNVKKLIGNEIELPNIPEAILKNDSHVYIVYNDHKFTVQPYENSVKRYCKLLGFDDRTIQKRIDFSNLKREGWHNFLKLQLFLICWSVVLSIVFSFALFSNGDIGPAIIIAGLLSGAVIFFGLLRRIKQFGKVAKKS